MGGNGKAHLFVDLANLRFGTYITDWKGTDNLLHIKYKPLSKHPFPPTVEIQIPNLDALVPAMRITDQEGTFECCHVLTVNEQGQSPFLKETFQERYPQLLQKVEEMRRKSEIKDAAQISEDVLLRGEKSHVYAEYAQNKKIVEGSNGNTQRSQRQLMGGSYPSEESDDF